MFEKCKNTKKQGDLGLGKAIGYLTECGYTVSLPLTDSQDYDVIVDIEEKLNRVQVKTTTYVDKYGTPCINLSVKGGNRTYSTIKKFDNTKVEYIFAVTGDNTRYFIPSSEIKSRNNLNLGKNYDKFKV